VALAGSFVLLSACGLSAPAQIVSPGLHTERRAKAQAGPRLRSNFTRLWKAPYIQYRTLIF
jgi:hypothetical protein